MDAALALSQTPSLLLDAMRRPRRRENRGKGGAQRNTTSPPCRNRQNNYLAETRRSKVGVPFGNRNAVKPERAVLRALRAEVKRRIAGLKAAIAFAKAAAAAMPRRRVTIFVRDGIVTRLCTRQRIAPCRAAAAVNRTGWRRFLRG